jgi:ribose transport system substrate-binding protein
MNGDIAAGRNPMHIPYIDNGYAVVTAENADSFYWNAYLERRGTLGIEE